MPKKILIFYTSVGLGHKTMAFNVAGELKAAGFEVRLEDIYQLQAGALISIGKVVHHLIYVYAPWIWRFLYTNEWFTNISLKYRVKVAAKNCQNVRRIINEYQPDAVIAAQTTASAVMAYLKSQGQYKGLFGITFSDYHLHRYWLYKEADFYLVNVPEQKTEMAKLGFEGGRIFVAGFALPPKPPINIGQLRQKFGIAPGDKVVLVSSGSLGIGVNTGVLDEFKGRAGIKVLVVCGKNQGLWSRLSEKYKNSNITVLGFYAPMDELYALAGVYVTKPGGLTVAEALRWHLPIYITYALPGQEDWNLKYLEARNLVMPYGKNLCEAIGQELRTGNFRRQLGNSALLKNLFPLPGETARALQAVLGQSKR